MKDGTVMLVWAVIWTLIAVCAFIGMLWNFAQWICACLAVFMACAFYYEYSKTRRK